MPLFMTPQPVKRAKAKPKPAPQFEVMLRTALNWGSEIVATRELFQVLLKAGLLMPLKAATKYSWSVYGESIMIGRKVVGVRCTLAEAAR